MTNPGTTTARDTHGPRRLALLAIGAVLAFHIAWEIPQLRALALAFVAGVIELRRAPTPRQAFCSGFVVGLGTFAPQLRFFWNIFGAASIALWCILAFWIGLFVLLAHLSRRQFTRWLGLLLIPFLWTGLEYFRSELYYLRFSWLSLGYTFFDTPNLSTLAPLGVYGIGFVLAALAAVLTLPSPRARTVWLVSATALLGIFLNIRANNSAQKSEAKTPLVAGVQLEFPGLPQILSSLDQLLARMPDVELIVLSEYTLDGPVPDALKDWCRKHQRHLIVGGKMPAPDSNFYNTAFVISPTGEIIFEQVKAVPIQFMKDGLPAPVQRVWNSPWGKLGLCICYDLSYTRPVDELIRQGAQALIVPTMDVIEWGKHQHELHTRIAPMRAAEYGVPIFRLASSGISQHLDARGKTLATAPFPGEEEILSGRLEFTPGKLPIDRFLSPACVGISGLTVSWLLITTVKTHSSGNRSPMPVS